MPGDREEQLATQCDAMAEAARAALQWTANNQDLVGNRRDSVDRMLKRKAVEARKLANAARRPMSVAVFGASQAGKSFLIGKMITPPEGEAARVDFGGGSKLDFLNEVNPTGGKETTGLVTRFSVTPEPVPAGYPVQLRLLREVDIAKILANTYAFDLGGEELPEQAVADRFASLESARQANELPGLSVEDVYELQDYVVQQLGRRHPMGRPGSAFWEGLERIAPFVSRDQRLQALSALWGDVSELNDLFLQLKDALDRLGHPSIVYTNLDAIADRSNGILHVETLHGLDEAKRAKMTDSERAAKTGSVTVSTREGQTLDLTKPIVTALTSELRVTLERPPWAFFDHTDLLDFPGARSREDSTVDVFIRKGRDDPNKGFTQAFLRGKVAVLFDSYVADLDLNSMVLCVDDSNQEVKMLPELVQGWIDATHGETSEQRAASQTAMFLTLTKCDRLFDEKAGADDADQMFSNRLSNNIDFYSSWTSSWQPNKRFDNVYLLRNPGFKSPGLFEYGEPPADAPSGEIGPELALTGAFQNRVDDLRNVFVNNEYVRNHLAEAERKFNALLKLNDGGVSVLAENLAPVCDPNLKFGQILARAQKTSQDLRAELSTFHESGDLDERIREREEKIGAVIDCLLVSDDLLGPLIAELCIESSTIAAGYRMHRARSTSVSAAATQQPRSRLAALVNKTEADEAPKSAQNEFAQHVISIWLGQLNEKASDEAFTTHFNLTTEHAKQLVSELSGLTERVSLAETANTVIQDIQAYTRSPDETAVIVGERLAMVLNRLVRDLEFGQSETVQENGTIPQFPTLPTDNIDMFRLGYILRWQEGLRETVRRNASMGSGGVVNAEQNRLLGELIATMKVEMAHA